MVVTEDEAKKKHCHLTLTTPPVYEPQGDLYTHSGPWPCMASGCMAWRVDKSRSDGAGYCGLAGKP